MNQFHEITTKELQANPFQIIGSDWMLVTAKKGDTINTMTAAWGGLGVMWGTDVAYIVLRPQRYTKEFVDASETFSLSFFEPKDKAILAYCGKVSGRDDNKIAKTGLTPVITDDTPYFSQAKTVLLCKKLYAQPMVKDGFMQDETFEKWYPENDLHTLYIAEITKVLVK